MTSDEAQRSSASTSPAQGEEPPMALEAARQVRWPFDEHLPMGEMWDQRRLTRNKLVWARDKGKWPDVRDAAIRFLHELDARSIAAVRRAEVLPTSAAPAVAPPQAVPAPQPPLQAALASQVVGTPLVNTAPARHGPKVVVASTYLAEQQENHFGMLMLIVGIGLAVLYFTLIDIVRKLSAGQTVGVIAAVVGLLAAAALFWWYFRKQGKAWRNARVGREGEEQVVNALREALDQRWTIYRNLQLPDKVADLDLVLVGPGGVWAVQVKNYRTPLRYHEGRWEMRRGKGWGAVDVQRSPERVKGQAAQLNEYLAKHGIQRWVETAIALAEGIPEKDIKDSPVPVWLPYNLAHRAAELDTRKRPDTAELGQINALLQRRADEQRAVEEDRQKRGK